jgi:putative membrane protein
MTNLRSLSYLTLVGVLSVSLAGACSDDDDANNNTGGRAGTSQGGGANDAGANQGGRAGTSFAGQASDGGFPSGTAGAGQGGAGQGGAGQGGAGQGGAATGGAGGGAAVAALSDAQILLVLDTLNQGEVEQAYAALPRLSVADVEAFAQMMVMHHNTARQSIAATAAVLDEAPTPSDTQAELKQAAEEQVARLRATPAASLDETYIEIQVAAHADALALISELATAADAADLATLLAAQQATVQQHYERAQEIQAEL